MKKALPFLLVLSACTNAEPVHTVGDFMADPTLLAETIAACRENPGRLSQTPNCRNAEQADWKSRLERMNPKSGG